MPAEGMPGHYADQCAAGGGAKEAASDCRPWEQRNDKTGCESDASTQHTANLGSG